MNMFRPTIDDSPEMNAITEKIKLLPLLHGQKKKIHSVPPMLRNYVPMIDNRHEICNAEAIILPCSCNSSMRTIIGYAPACFSGFQRPAMRDQSTQTDESCLSENKAPIQINSASVQPYTADHGKTALAKMAVPSCVRPNLTWGESKKHVRNLARQFRENPELQMKLVRNYCYNCRSPNHKYDTCPWPCGTFCTSCGEPGVKHKSMCPPCNPKNFGLHINNHLERF